MKTTLDIPDVLYRRFKMRAAMNGETIRHATLTFITSYVNGRACGLDGAGVPMPAKGKRAGSLPEWAGLAESFIREHADGPHDMETIRRAIGRKLKAERRS